MSYQDAEKLLLQKLEPELKNKNFKFIRARRAFERTRESAIDLYKLEFYTSMRGRRIQPAIVMRFPELDRLYHQVSNAKPADRKYHAAISFEIWRLYGGVQKYEFLLTGEESVEAVCAQLLAAFQDVALPFFEQHSSIRAIDQLLNSTPEEYQTRLYNSDDWTRCAYATIAARLAGNSKYDALRATYEEMLKKRDGGGYVKQYTTLRQLLEDGR